MLLAHRLDHSGMEESKMLIKNASFFNEKFEKENGDIYIKGSVFEKIGDCGECDSEIVDLKGKMIIPGFINIHTHGAVGYNVVNATREGYEKIGRYWASNGTTSYLMAPATYLKEDLKKYVSVIADCIKNKTSGANLLGINMEGPYLSDKYKGAHKSEWLRNTKEVDFDEINEAAGGNILVTTIAPEIDGAIDFIKEYKDKVKISLGHTGADYETCMKAFEAGATQVTHLFNAMPPVHHRNLSLISAAFESGAMAEIICDGLHVDKNVVMMAYKIFGADRLIVINDSVMAAGMPEGVYNECGVEIYVKDGIARHKDGTISGGTATIYQCVKNLVSWGVPLADASKMASYNPAKALGIKGKGLIKEGYDADFVVLSDDLSIEDVYISGKVFK